jgi:Metallo-peptidase family M12B Reprolysin-like/Secretion system C-terminal sorting domain
MRKIPLLMALFFFAVTAFAQKNDFWKSSTNSRLNTKVFENKTRPDKFQVFELNRTALTEALRKTPLENTENARASSFILSFPNPEGIMESFRVVEAPVMEAALAAKYPDIKSYAGQGIEDPGATIRFDMTPAGFHAMVLSNTRSTYYIDPAIEKDNADNLYLVFARKDVQRHEKFECLVKDMQVPGDPAGVANRSTDDGRRRQYRLALAATGEYSQHFLNGTETSDAERRAKVLAAMNTTMTRVNGIYERDFSVRMVLVANNTNIIYLNAATDPWTTNFNSVTQTTIDAQIGNANYDIGHLAHKAGNNGNAGCIGCVCRTGQKGSAFTSTNPPTGDLFNVDYLAHEMGHQFGANHTFSANEGTAAGMEPGSGSTIMGYAGITGATTDVQTFSDDYFHSRSIEQVSDYIKSATGNACAAVTITGNTAPTANAGADFIIPRSTPFTLTGSGTDANGDPLTYLWEQFNSTTNANFYVPASTNTTGPVFRSRRPSTTTSRTFPILSSILNGTNTNKWEVLPSVGRTLNFRLLVADNRAGGGNNKDDNMVVTVNGSSGPFLVTAPNTAVTWTVGTTQTVTWSVNSTNLAPVNCTSVRIHLSTDGGLTFPITLNSNTPNDGTQTITVPNNPSTQCRIRVSANNNIFFDIGNVNFTIRTAVAKGGGNNNLRSLNEQQGVSLTSNTTTINNIQGEKTVNLFTNDNDQYTVELMDVSGRLLQRKQFNSRYQLNMSAYTKGMYIITSTNNRTKEKITQKVVL